MRRWFLFSSLVAILSAASAGAQPLKLPEPAATDPLPSAVPQLATPIPTAPSAAAPVGNAPAIPATPPASAGNAPLPYVAPIYCPPINPGMTFPGMTYPGMSGVPSDPNSLTPTPAGTTPQAIQDAASPFAQSTEGGGLAARSFDNPMFGDFGGVFYRRTEFITRSVQVGTKARTVGIDPITQLPVIVNDPLFANQTVARTTTLPLNGRYSGFKMSDQETARPTDRVYFAYSYYSNVYPGQNGDLLPVDQHRQTLGFEKTLLGGNASIGLRIPFVQTNGEGTLNTSNVGDLSVLMKYALVNDPLTGTVRTVGLIVTAPTGNAGVPTGALVDGTLPHSTILQPWFGFAQSLGERFYTQGFSSIMVPLGTSEPTVIFNSFALGFWLFKNGQGLNATGLAPVTEIHFNTPLTNRNSQGTIYMPDQLNLTHGLHLLLPRAVLGTAVSYPLLRPNPFKAEVQATLNFRF